MSYDYLFILKKTTQDMINIKYLFLVLIMELLSIPRNPNELKMLT